MTLLTALTLASLVLLETRPQTRPVLGHQGRALLLRDTQRIRILFGALIQLQV